MANGPCFRCSIPLCTIALLIGPFAPALQANSAQTYFDGTMGSLPFLSKYVDITHERITIVPDSGFMSARFHIEYEVRSTRDGMRTPMVFYALEYATGFRVLFDGVELSVRSIPSQAVLNDTTLAEVAGNFHVITWSAPSDKKEVVPNVNVRFNTSDLLFFTADFKTGTHTIVFDYTAAPFRDISTLTETRELRYALSPASTWRSFGTLDVELDLSSAGEGDIETQLGTPHIEPHAPIWSWSFKAIPADEIRIKRHHHLNATARMLTAIGPEGLALIVLVFLAIWHAAAIKLYRDRRPDKISWALVIGGFLVPFLCLAAYVFSYSLIKKAAGMDGYTPYGNYSGMAFFLYPFVMPVYFGLAWGWDFRCKRNKRGAVLTAP